MTSPHSPLTMLGLLPDLALPLAPRQDQDAITAEAPDELLRWLLRFPLLRVEELAFLADISRSRAYARMSALRNRELIARWRAPGMAGAGTQLYALTPRGITTLATVYGTVAWSLAHQWQADERGLQRLLLRTPTLLMTQSCVLALLAGASEALGLHASPPMENTSERGRVAIEWSWQRDYFLRFTQRTHSGRLRFDAYVRFAASVPNSRGAHTAPRRWYGLFILAANGMCDTQDQRHCLRAAAHCREAWLDQAPTGCFPPLLILAADAYQAAQWQAQALRLATGQWQTHPLVGAILCLEDADVATPWQAAWQSLLAGSTCRLTDVLSPVDEAQRLPPLLSADVHDRRHSVTRRAVPRSQADSEGRPSSPTLLDRLTQRVQRLDPRHLSVLKLLYEHPLLCTRDLAALLGIADASVDRYLRLLNQLELIGDEQASMVRPSDGGEPARRRDADASYDDDTRYALTRLGLGLLAAQAGRTGWRVAGGTAASSPQTGRIPHYIACYERDVAWLAHTRAHTAGVYSFFAHLALAAHQAPLQGSHHRLLWWETGRACERHYRELDGWHALRPDGAGEYQAGLRRLRFWLEWDRGTMNRRDLEVKFAAYDHYRRSGEWRIDGNVPLPCLLIVTAAERQLPQLALALNTTMMGPHLPLTIYMTTSKALATHGAFAAIWRSWTPHALSALGGLGALIPLM